MSFFLGFAAGAATVIVVLAARRLWRSIRDQLEG